MGSKKDRIFRKIRIIIDVLNVILGLAVIGAIVYTFLDARNRMYMFSYIFYAGAVINAITGIKHMISEKRMQGIGTWVFAGVLIAAGYVSRVVVGSIR